MRNKLYGWRYGGCHRGRIDIKYDENSGLLYDLKDEECVDRVTRELRSEGWID